MPFSSLSPTVEEAQPTLGDIELAHGRERGMESGAPTPGDWFRLTEAASGLALHKGAGAWHPFLVKSTWPGPRATLLPRSTSWTEGRHHSAHQGACGSATCALDEDGRIGSNLVTVDKGVGTDYSCHEPDEEVIEWAMSLKSPSSSSKRRGRR